ncbi:Fc receptor-like protein 3 [Orycteropus afer afer]|uniref:Fc receptor-like protein 3 n=1 Tax=Orycteropus afer afer TaxID=1230840 RepID=A0AC54ZD22_ORYAF|nr:Fc receptor-like protein 3 [Orycteropus afer afer]
MNKDLRLISYMTYLPTSRQDIGGRGAAPKAVVLLHPPWSVAFKGETVELTCQGPDSPSLGDTYWYHKENLLKMKSETIKIKHSGEYQCKTRGSSLSDPVNVVFSSDWLILQASQPVFEGDDVYLRCRGRKDYKILERSYYKDEEELDQYKNVDAITLYSISMDNGEYHCTASGITVLRWTEHSNHLRIQVHELFPPPKLRAIPSNPIEGSPVALKCETWIHPQRSHTQLQFCFFRGDQILGEGWSTSPQLQIPTMWNENSRSYWCMAQTDRIKKRSSLSQIPVQRIPVSDVNLEIRPPGGQVIEGEDLVLICSVAKGTGTITFSWYKEGTVNLGRKTTRSLWAELPVPNVKECDTGKYYCTADNVHGPILSKWIVVTVIVPVSQPVLTLWTPRAQPVVGDMVELHCEAQRGSPPILYKFYQEDVTLGNSSGLSGGASLNLSLAAEHSGSYSCEAENDLRVQRSHKVTLNIIIPVSRPVLTLWDPKAQPVPGDMVKLHCEAQKGSPPILYQFYHENVSLGYSSAPSGGRASFNFSVTIEHSGNYLCEASNGLEVQRSDTVALNVIGGIAATGTPSHAVSQCKKPSLSRLSSTDLKEPSYSQPLGLVELHPEYSNVNTADSNLVYSQVLSIQVAKGKSANSSRMCQEDKEHSVIYSELKKAHPNDSPEQSNSRDMDYKENYENVP